MGLLTDNSKEQKLREKVRKKREQLNQDDLGNRDQVQRELGDALEKLEQETGETNTGGLQLDDGKEKDLDLLEESDNNSEISFETDEDDKGGIF
jgi:hypothetical protein